MAEPKVRDEENIFPEKDAAEKMRKYHEERRTRFRPSKEMDEIIKGTPAPKEEPVRKIAKPKRDPDLDLP
jgi:hypothetical protein